MFSSAFIADFEQGNVSWTWAFHWRYFAWNKIHFSVRKPLETYNENISEKMFTADTMNCI